MDPILGRLTRGASRRTIVLVAVGGGAVLAAAVVAAGAGAAGSESTVPVVALTGAASPAPTPLLVQVGGAVHRPGLVSVPAGARVIDAVTAAGGATDRADPGAVNLAAPVSDGQQVLVPVKPPPGAPAAAGSTPSAPNGTGGGKVGLNSATADQLETLPRIGPALAARILAWRSAHGAFRSVDDLGQVAGIGPRTLAGLRDRVTL